MDYCILNQNIANFYKRWWQSLQTLKHAVLRDDSIVITGIIRKYLVLSVQSWNRRMQTSFFIGHYGFYMERNLQERNIKSLEKFECAISSENVENITALFQWNRLQDPTSTSASCCSCVPCHLFTDRPNLSFTPAEAMRRANRVKKSYSELILIILRQPR